MFTNKKRPLNLETKKTWCVVFHRFPKLHNQQKKQLYFYTPENVNNLKKKVDMKRWLTAYSVMIFQKAQREQQIKANKY